MRELSFNLERAIAPQPIVLEPLTATENGTYTPALGVNGYSSVEVAVPIPPAPVLTTLSVSENGTYTPEQGVDGFSEVEVEVPSGKILIEGDIHDGFKKQEIWEQIVDNIEFGVITRLDGAFIYNYSKHAIPPITIGDNFSWGFNAFSYSGIEHAPTFIPATTSGYVPISNISFHSCENLIDCYLPNCRADSQKIDYLFSNCHRLRAVDEDFLATINDGGSDFAGGFEDCFSIDAIHNYPLCQSFSTFLQHTYRLKSFTYKDFGAAQRIGNITVKMNGKGYVGSGSTARDYFLQDTDFTTDTEITDAASYAALKNNPDYWTQDVAYSRYNRASAAETIASLPTNIYLSPIIQFTGNAGANTDEGAISTLTPEEIAVATTKGWTVSYV